MSTNKFYPSSRLGPIRKVNERLKIETNATNSTIISSNNLKEIIN